MLPRLLCQGSLLLGVCTLPVLSQPRSSAARWSFTIEQRYGDTPGAELAAPQFIPLVLRIRVVRSG